MTNTTNTAAASFVITKHYAKRDPEAQGDHYINHVSAMTGEGLHTKSDIAAELAHRDIEIDRLRTGYDAARLEIASLRERVQQLGQLARDVNSRRVVELEAQLAAVGAGGVEPLRKRADEIEADVARSGSIAAMNCYTKMRQLLQAATAPQPAQSAPVDAAVQQDAERWQFFADYMVSTRTDLDDEIVGCDSVQKMARVLDAARAAQEGKHD